MTNKTYTTNTTYSQNPHGGYRKLLSFQTATIIYDLTVEFCKTYLSNPEAAANCLICLIHQANYLLDRQIQALEKQFIQEGGFSENLLKRRLEIRSKPR